MFLEHLRRWLSPEAGLSSASDATATLSPLMSLDIDCPRPKEKCGPPWPCAPQV